MKRRAIFLLATMAATLVVASGVALAATIHCPSGGVLCFGTGGDDEMYGTDGVDRLWGDSGNDTMSTFEGDDFLYGVGGDDDLWGGSGNDLYYFDFSGPDDAYGSWGSDYINDTSGRDTLQVRGEEGSWVGIALDSGLAWNIYDSTQGGVTISNGRTRGDAIEDVRASSERDFIGGTNGVNRIFGGGGDDMMNGGGHDFLRGDAGNDSVDGGDWMDSVSGGDGNDTVYGGNASDGLYHGGVFGGAGDDRVYGDYGGEIRYGGNDVIYGDAGLDRMYGGPGDDTIHAKDGLQDLEVDCDTGTDTVYADSSDRGIISSSCERVVF